MPINSEQLFKLGHNMLIMSRQDFKTEFQHFEKDSTRAQNWKSACQECLKECLKVGFHMPRNPQQGIKSGSPHVEKFSMIDQNLVAT